jgi:hypothetical protein
MIRTGFKKAVTVGTPVAVGAGDGIYLLSEAIKSDVPRIDDTSAGGSRQLRGADISGKSFAGPLRTPARYEGRWLTLLAALFGVAGAPTGGGPHVHTFTPGADNSGIFGTLAIDKQVGANPVWEYDTVWVQAVTLRSEAGTGEAARLTAEFELIGRSLSRASATNGATQMNALTFPAAGHLLHHHLTVRMNSSAGGALGAPDVLKARRIELMLRNHFADKLFTSGSQFIDTPAHENHLEVTGTIELDKYDADAPGVTEFLDGTYMKADLTWTTGASAIFLAEIPFLQIIGADREMRGPGLIGRPIPFKGYDPTAAPTGMFAVDSAAIRVTNNFATDYLA